MKDKNNKLFISMYHYIRDLKYSRYPNIKGMDIRQFRAQMEFFRDNFNVVKMEQVIEAVKSGGKLPQNAVLLTFDDGYIDHYTYVFPVLEEFGFQGSFFIPGKPISEHKLLDVNKIHHILACADIKSLVIDVKERMNHYRGSEYNYASTDELWNQYAIENRFDSKEVVFIKRVLQTALPEPVRNKISSDLFERYVDVSEEQVASELYMSEEQIGVMRRHGMFIGLHGYEHYWLGNLTREEMACDISKAMMVMCEYINPKEWVMNYPYGNYSLDVISYVESKGACVGLTTKVQVADIEVDSALELPRLDCNDFPPQSNDYIYYL